MAPGSQQRVGRDAELHQLLLRLDLRLGKMTTLRLGDVLHLGLAVADLDGRVAVLFLGARGDDLHLVKVQHGDGHMGAVILEYAGHTELFGQQTGAERLGHGR